MNRFVFKSIILFTFALFLMSPSCDKEKKDVTSQNTNTANDSIPLKKIDENDLSKSYADLWKSIDSLEQLGLYQSALNHVEIVIKKSTKENVAEQLVKSVIFKMKYNTYLKEDDYILAINDLNTIAENAKTPLRQITYSIAGDVYWSYYQQNRYKFLNRSETIGFKNDDLRTWDLKKIVDQTYQCYQLSLSDASTLQSLSIDQFKEIIIKGNADKQRPTLYDFLAYKALDFFKNSETNLSRPAEKFNINEAYYFDNNESYLAKTKTSNLFMQQLDSMSNLLYAARIINDLTLFHSKDENPDALIEITLTRFNFAKVYCNLDQKSDLYIKALEELATKYSKVESAAEINYNIANYYYQLGKTYTNINKEHRWMLKKANELCEQTILKFPKSYGAELCQSLKESILSKNYSFQLESSYPSNKAAKFSLKYQNVNQLYFRIYKVNWDYDISDNYYSENSIKDLLKRKAQHQWNVKLKETEDFQKHTIEYKLPELSKGNYVIVASSNEDFTDFDNAIASSSFWITDLSYVARNDYQEGSYEIYITDKFTGKPLSNVNVTLYQKKYNYTSRKYENNKKTTLKSNEKGLVKIIPNDKENNYNYSYLLLNYGDDQFIKPQAFYSNKYSDYHQASISTHLFIDRSIYRPGQTIYFKGICIKNEAGNKHNIIPNHKTTVRLVDVNYQEVKQIEVTTNEFGTFSGSFTLPQGLLNGSMHLETPNGSKYFSVEEYKRPKFEVKMNPIKGTFKLGQKITVEGKASTYAGANIDQANVNYRVVRNSSFPSWISYRYRYFTYQNTSLEVANGTIKTDENGIFKITFEAKVDASLDKKYRPTYSYQIIADVTDATGETQSTQSYVNVAYQALQLNVQIPDQLEKNEGNKFKISSTNFMGEKVKTTGWINIYQLKEKDKIYRKSKWETPDILNFSKEDYQKYFPVDTYNTSDDNQAFEKGDLIVRIPFNTEKTDSFEIKNLKNMLAGRYQIEAISTDEFGEDVIDIKQLVLLDKNSTKNPTNEILKIVPLNNLCEPGDKSEFLISSAIEGLYVLYEIEQQGVIVSSKIITLNKEQQLISIPIEEKHRGNLTIHFSSNCYGDYQNFNFDVIVPFSNKTLAIEFETLRDKLLPGQMEQWKLKISGPKGEKVLAEMLASMYDASLDQFAENNFYLNIFESFYSTKNWNYDYDDIKYSSFYQYDWNQKTSYPSRTYDHLNWFGYYLVSMNYYYNDAYDGDVKMLETVSRSETGSKSVHYKNDKKESSKDAEISGFAIEEEQNFEQANGLVGGNKGKIDGIDFDIPNENNIKTRSNFNETAFFFPHLTTDKDGNVIINFTVPESLTRWKFMALAHTKDLKIGTTSKEVVTQKELMITPYTPRFLRESDQISITAKIDNLSDSDLNGTSKLLLFNALTNESVDIAFKNNQSLQNFDIKKGQSQTLTWDITVPSGIEALKYKVLAQAKNHTDGEENVLPILSNRILVTESLPLPSKTSGTKEFKLEKLLNSGNSTSIKHHSLTLEYTSNPAWYAVQALPYMMEYPYECAEQTFSRFYANSIASQIIRSNPKIKSVFESWKNQSPDALISNLEKNQELKNLFIEETPWVLQAQNESERKKRISLLFDYNKMDNELNSALDKLNKMQSSNGAWPWFKGMPENRYITQHIVTGMGHLNHLGVKDVHEDSKTWNMVKNAVKYLDNRIEEDFKYIKKHDPNYLNNQHLSQLHIQYLYARSYFQDISVGKELQLAMNYFQNQAKTYWKNFDIQNEAMIALQAKRFQVEKLPEQIMASLKERAIVHDELGMYWKDNVSGYYWYQAPIETQAIMIEAFDEITNDQSAVNELKVWLLKQKQTTDWKTTKATAEACYALLLKGTSILESENDVEITVGTQRIDPKAMGLAIEEGTGYFKKTWKGSEVKPEMGKVTVTKKSNNVSWGAIYWQYFEDLDKITTHETPLKLSKKYFVVQNTASGPVISPIVNSKLKPGDKVRVRIELRTDRDMEYVHLKDMRASGYEPVNVFSQYKWQDGLGYYECTKDASTNFFIDYLSKGTYVFEYDVKVTHYGNFSNGISTIQCMYAPEFTSHSQGSRVEISKDLLRDDK